LIILEFPLVPSEAVVAVVPVRQPVAAEDWRLEDRRSFRDVGNTKFAGFMSDRIVGRSPIKDSG